MNESTTRLWFWLETFKRRTESLAHVIAAVSGWTIKKSISVARWPVPEYTRPGMYFQAAFVVLLLVWFEYQPDWAVQGTTVAMGLLAIAAVIMGLRGASIRRVEGTLWVILSVLLFAGEMQAIVRERKARDEELAQAITVETKARNEERDSFRKLLARGEALLNSLDEEKSLTSKNLALTAKNLEHITGGDEYCWVAPQTPLLSTAAGEPYIDNKSGNWQIVVMNSGKVVLPTCDVSLMEIPSAEQLKSGMKFSWFPHNMHFERLPVLGGGGGHYFQMTSYLIPGGRNYSGVIRTPARELIEVITFDPDPKSLSGYTPHCKVLAPGGTKELQSDCFPK
jgi:hypothetical protein